MMSTRGKLTQRQQTVQGASSYIGGFLTVSRKLYRMNKRNGPPKISIVIPVLNDAQALGRVLADLAATPAELLVVDGGSTDGSDALAEAGGARLLRAPPGRGGQLAAGIAAARGDWLWLLHADTRVTSDCIVEILRIAASAPGWGGFDVCMRDSYPLRLVAAAMNLRSRLTGICTGDQGIFVHRRLLESIGGMPRQPLMEDIEISRCLRRLAAPLRPRTALRPDPRRWRQRGVLVTILMMWWCRVRYFMGADPEHLYRAYYGADVHR